MKPRMYTIYHPDCQPFSLVATSAQNACRQAFRHWIKEGKLKRQPKTIADGGFKDVEVQLH